MEAFYPGVWSNPLDLYAASNPTIAQREAFLSDPNYMLGSNGYAEYFNRQLQQSGEVARRGAMGLGKSYVYGSILGSFNIGINMKHLLLGTGDPLMSDRFGSRLPFRARVARGMTQVTSGVLGTLDYGPKPMIPDYKESGMLRNLNSKNPRKGGGVVSRILRNAMPTGTGFRSMLFWNFATGNYQDNFKDMPSLVANWGKFALGAQLLDVGRTMLTPYMRQHFGQMGQGFAKWGRYDLAFDEVIGHGLKKELLKEGSRIRKPGLIATASKMMDREPGVGLSNLASAAEQSTKNLVRGGMMVVGTAARALNWLSGMSAAWQVSSAFSDYRNNIRTTMFRESINFDTAYAATMETAEASSERQRAIEAIQNSSMNLRTFMGGEAALMHR